MSVLEGSLSSEEEDRDFWSDSESFGVRFLLHVLTQQGAMSDPNSVIHADAILILSITVPQVRGDQVAEEMNLAFTAALDRTGASKVVVNFHGVEFMTSVGFRPLLGLHRRVKAVGGRVVLCHLSPVVAEVLQVTRFIDATKTHPAPFEVQPDLVSAVTSLLNPG
jgi:anti-anti-sigma factor